MWHTIVQLSMGKTSFTLIFDITYILTNRKERGLRNKEKEQEKSANTRWMAGFSPCWRPYCTCSAAVCYVLMTQEALGIPLLSHSNSEINKLESHFLESTTTHCKSIFITLIILHSSDLIISSFPSSAIYKTSLCHHLHVLDFTAILISSKSGCPEQFLKLSYMKGWREFWRCGW